MGKKAAGKRRRREEWERMTAELRAAEAIAWYQSPRRSLNVDASLDAGGGRGLEVAVTLEAERSLCPRCGAPVDLFDLFGVLELRFDPEDVERDAIAAGGERRSWRSHVCAEPPAASSSPGPSPAK